MSGEPPIKKIKTENVLVHPVFNRDIWSLVMGNIRRIKDFKAMLMVSKKYHAVFWYAVIHREIYLRCPPTGPGLERYSQALRPFVSPLRFVKVDEILLLHLHSDFHSAENMYVIKHEYLWDVGASS